MTAQDVVLTAINVRDQVYPPTTDTQEYAKQISAISEHIDANLKANPNIDRYELTAQLADFGQCMDFVGMSSYGEDL